MERKAYRVRFTWKIWKEGSHGIYRTGISCLQLSAEDIVEVVNSVIKFAEHIPSADMEANDIDISAYMDGCQCKYYTALVEINRIFILKGVHSYARCEV